MTTDEILVSVANELDSQGKLDGLSDEQAKVMVMCVAAARLVGKELSNKRSDEQ